MVSSIQPRARRRQLGHALQQVRITQGTPRCVVHSRRARWRWRCWSSLLPNLRFSIALLKRFLPDIRRLPNLPSTPHCLLLWHRRMLPLARLHPSFLLSPLQSPASTLGARYREYGPEYDNRKPDVPFPFFIASFTIICNERP